MSTNTKKIAATVHVSDFYQWLKIVARIKWSSDQHVLSGVKEYIGPRWIFRGMANASWEIKSSFEINVLEKYEALKYDVLNDEMEYTLRAKEVQAINYYRQWAKGHFDANASNGEILALMQHTGAPTRLVDFTEIPLVGLYFALENQNEAGDFAVWASVADTSQNSYVEKLKKKAEPKILVEMKGFRAWEKPVVELDYDNISLQSWDESDRNEFEELVSNVEKKTKCPVLKYLPRILNSRQRAQRGLFLANTKLTSHFMPAFLSWVGVSDKELQEETDVSEILLPNGCFTSEFAGLRLIKFVFPKTMRECAKEFLAICNLNKQSLFDDLQGTTEQVRLILETPVSKAKLQGLQCIG